MKNIIFVLSLAVLFSGVANAEVDQKMYDGTYQCKPHRSYVALIDNNLFGNVSGEIDDSISEPRMVIGSNIVSVSFLLEGIPTMYRLNLKVDEDMKSVSSYIHPYYISGYITDNYYKRKGQKKRSVVINFNDDYSDDDRRASTSLGIQLVCWAG